jgi:hypothetical protein
VASISVVDVAQLVEHRIVIPSVAGSSPVIHPNFLPEDWIFTETSFFFKSENFE